MANIVRAALVQAAWTGDQESMTERSIELLNYHFGTEGASYEFQRTIRYLRSPETDALFLRRVQKGLSVADYHFFLKPDFLGDHVEEILPLLVKHLEHRDMDTRRQAKNSLEMILARRSGWRVGWQNLALAGTQPELVEKCRAEVQAYLALWRSRAAAAE